MASIPKSIIRRSRRALQRAVDAAGGQKQLAEQIGTSQQYIWNCLNRNDDIIRAELVLAVQKATGVEANELRPDIYPEDVSAA